MMRAAGRRVAMGRAAGNGGLGGLMLAVALVLAAPSEAQAPMSVERCKTVMTIITGIIHEYSGQISKDFIADLQKKIGTDAKCDGPDQYRIWPNTKDREALNRIRQLIAVWDACKKDPKQEGCK